MIEIRVKTARLAPGWYRPVLQEQLRGALDKIGRELRKRARRYAPKETGALRKAIDYRLEYFELVFGVLGGSEDLRRRAEFLERGGTVRAKRGRYLTIPKSHGIAKRGEARSYSLEETFVRPLASGNLGLFLRGDPPQLLYTLTPEVTVRGRRFIERALDGVMPMIPVLIADALQRSAEFISERIRVT